MYQPKPSPGDRVATIAAVVAIHLGLAFALINLSGPVREALPAEVVEIFDVTEPPPPPPVIEQIPEPETATPEREEGAASPKNIESQATPVVAPKPPIQLPIPVPIPVTQTPGQGSDRTQGASNVVGPGTGAGGQGTGTGSGGSGSGTGGGGQGLASVRTRMATRPLTGRDFPNELLDRWPLGAAVFMRFRVNADGRIIQCIVDRGTGDPTIDSAICATAQARLRYVPATDENGRRVADWAAYGQRPPR